MVQAKKSFTDLFPKVIGDMRVATLFLFWCVVGGVIVFKLFDLQVLKFDFYNALASDQHEFFQKLFPERGEIYVQDRFLVNGDDKDNVYPVAINKKYALVYAMPKYVTDPMGTATAIAPILGVPTEELLAKLSKQDDPYEPLKHKVEPVIADQIDALHLPGIKQSPETYRYYPEAANGEHVLGFVGLKDDQRVGRYGIEGRFENELHGVQGTALSETDGFGRLLSFGASQSVRAQDGDDIVLTVDKTLQSQLCKMLSERAAELQAKSGALIVVAPSTGAVRAMCSYPDFDPNEYNKVDDIRAYNNTAIYGAYEPGSVFKVVTMAAALDTGSVTPETTYVDEGQVNVDDRTLRNAARKGYGLQTMTEVLEKSLNTGTVFAMRQMGPDTLKQYIRAFDFGIPTGIELSSESKGNIDTLEKRGEIFAATASFGQGITATPIQMVTAINAIANGGLLVKPYIVAEIRKSDGEVIAHSPQPVKQVIQNKTATVLSGMLVSVIDHSKHARLQGYHIAGKTGTAQIADGSGGYAETRTNHSIVGFGPLERPMFSLIIKLEEPQQGQFAESTVGPLFADVVRFLLNYHHIPPSY